VQRLVDAIVMVEAMIVPSLLGKGFTKGHARPSVTTKQWRARPVNSETRDRA
jgi:hypothetical protein